MLEKDIEKLAEAELTRSGAVYWFPPHSYGRERDIFGVFDVAVYRSGVFFFIQLTSIQHITDRQKKILGWALKKKIILPPGSAEVWAWDKKTSKFVVRPVSLV